MFLSSDPDPPPPQYFATRWQVNPPNPEEAALVENRTLISLLFPAQNGDLVKQLEGQGATVMSMDCIPRMLSRGQTYDVLSSQVGCWLEGGDEWICCFCHPGSLFVVYLIGRCNDSSIKCL